MEAGMDWAAFIGSLSGAVIGCLVLLGGVFIWDEHIRRTNIKSKPVKLPLDDILERHLEEYIVQHFSDLFPGWRIYHNTPNEIMEDTRFLGIRFRTKIIGEIDLLCIDDKDDFVVIELKRKRASDKVIVQVDRYIAWVKKHLASPEQDVRGIIIARTFSDFLTYSLAEREKIDIWAYQWHLGFESWMRENKTSNT
jgi:RecB family endonuclease NucS